MFRNMFVYNNNKKKRNNKEYIVRRMNKINDTG